MALRPRVWFFYDNNRQSRRTSATLSDEQVQSAILDDIAPLVAASISQLLPIPITANIEFWRLNEPRDSDLPANVPLEDLATKLKEYDPIEPYVSRGPAPVNLVVKWKPHILDGRKRAREEAHDGVVENAKRAKIAIESPPSLALPTAFRSWHKGPNKSMIDHRFVYDEPPDFVDDLPPISLQYEGFGHFLDIFRGRKDVPGMNHVSSIELRLAVDDFAEKMIRIYPDEYSRRSKGLDALNKALSVRTDYLAFQLIPATVSNKASPDGHILGPHKAAYCIIVFKNEPACASIPYVEMTSYFAHSTGEATEQFASVMEGWNIPCLGLTIIGHYVTFYAMIFFGQWRVVALTPGLSCIRASGDGDDRNALYDAFTATSVLLARISTDAAQLVATPCPPIQGSRVLPPIWSLPHPHSGSRIKFKILEPFSFKATDRLLYIAKTNDGEGIIVKFTRRYSYELHMFCADRGFAPKLRGFERLPGGLFCIAMDFFNSASQIAGSLPGPKTTEWGEQLQELVKAFHAENLVHGDLRSPNIICDGKRVMIVDFDWGGKLGEVSYPNGPLNADLTDGREQIDLKITKADDLRVLCRTLKSVQLECDYCRSKSP